MSHGRKNSQIYSKKVGSNKRSDNRRKRDEMPGTDDANAKVRDSSFPRHNDPAWYNQYPQLTKDAASFSFATPLGEYLDAFGADLDFGEQEATTHKTVPGVMAISLLPTPGVCVDYNSPINVMAQSIYSYVCHANSRSGKYDANDLVQYVFAASQAYVIFATLSRAYGTLTSYSRNNRYYARGIVEAMGFDYDDLLENIADFRAYINTFALRLGSLCVPKDFTFINRYVYLFGNIFMDSDRSKAQSYLYVPSHVWLYDEMGDERGGVLYAEPFCRQSTANMTFAKIKNLADRCIRDLMLSQSLDTMGADIRKAYGENNLLTVTTIPEEYRVLPMYDPRGAMEMANLTEVGYFDPDHEDNRILADVTTEGLKFDPVFTLSHHKVLPNRLILNVKQEQVEPNDVMKATRLTALPKHLVTDAEGEVHLSACGSEVCVGIDIIYNAIDDQGMSVRNTHIHTFMNPNANGIQITDLIALSKFAWHPNVYVMYVNNEGSSVFAGVFGELDNYTQITHHDLKKLHEVALFSEYYNPNMGTFLRG